MASTPQTLRPAHLIAMLPFCLARPTPCPFPAPAAAAVPAAPAAPAAPAGQCDVSPASMGIPGVKHINTKGQGVGCSGPLVGRLPAADPHASECTLGRRGD